MSKLTEKLNNAIWNFSVNNFMKLILESPLILTKHDSFVVGL